MNTVMKKRNLIRGAMLPALLLLSAGCIAERKAKQGRGTRETWSIGGALVSRGWFVTHESKKIMKPILQPAQSVCIGPGDTFGTYGLNTAVTKRSSELGAPVSAQPITTPGNSATALISGRTVMFAITCLCVWLLTISSAGNGQARPFGDSLTAVANGIGTMAAAGTGSLVDYSSGGLQPRPVGDRTAGFGTGIVTGTGTGTGAGTGTGSRLDYSPDRHQARPFSGDSLAAAANGIGTMATAASVRTLVGNIAWLANRAAMSIGAFGSLGYRTISDGPLLSSWSWNRATEKRASLSLE